MKPNFTLLSGLLCIFGSLSSSADVLISQFYEGSSSNKWIELSNTGNEAVPLTGYHLALFSNSRTEDWRFDGATAQANFVQDLGDFSIPANGSLLIGNSSAVLPAYASADLSSASANFNGDDSVVLYNEALGPLGDVVSIADCISFTDAGNEGANTSFYRLSNDSGFDVATFGSTVLDFPAVWGVKSNTEVNDAGIDDDWYLHAFADSATSELTVTLSVSEVEEGAGDGVVDITVTRSGATEAALAISIESDDATEAAIPTPDREIPAGEASATFAMAIDAIDDAIADGTQTVTITAKATGFTSGTAELQVLDDGDVAPVIINEILADPASGLAGDANGDGDRDSSDDEFVEIVNLSGADVDLSDWEIRDSSSMRHIFPAGTILPKDCAIVVFGGGLLSGLGGGAEFQSAFSGNLALNNSGDTVTLLDSEGVEVDSVTYGEEGGENQSITRSPDRTGEFAQHSLVGGSLGDFSPGTLSDGSEFCVPAGTLSIELSASEISEPDGSLTATITRTGDLGAELEVQIQFDDPTEAVAELDIPGFEFIPAGEASVSFPINVIDDVEADGTQTVTIRAIAPGLATGMASFDVLDDGDGAFEALVINEFLYDPPAGEEGNANGDADRDSSEDEFVEILNVSEEVFDLSNYEIHDEAALRHIFTEGTILAPGRAIIVFGGGSPQGTFGGSLVQVASTGFLGLSNSGDSVILKAPGGGSELLRVAYDGSVDDVALTRSPDGDGEFVPHSGVEDAAGALFSPGTKTDGSAFPGGVEPGTLVLEDISVDTETFEVTVRIHGLQPGVQYSIDASLQLGLDPWQSVQNVTIADGTEVAPGVYEFVVVDSLIEFEGEQFYRVSQP